MLCKSHRFIVVGPVFLVAKEAILRLQSLNASLLNWNWCHIIALCVLRVQILSTSLVRCFILLTFFGLYILNHNGWLSFLHFGGVLLIDHHPSTCCHVFILILSRV